MIDLQKITELIFSQYGFFATIFFLLLCYVLHENNKRELRYQDIINKNQDVILTQATSFEIVKVMKDDLDDLKTIILSK